MKITYTQRNYRKTERSGKFAKTFNTFLNNENRTVCMYFGSTHALGCVYLWALRDLFHAHVCGWHTMKRTDGKKNIMNQEKHISKQPRT